MHQVEFTNLNKVFWPEGLTKYDLAKYYLEVAPVLLPHLFNRPLVLKRYPNGITGDHFYQKECPDHAPPWVETLPVVHHESGKTINYVLCNNQETLAWLANLGCIEIHAWLSRAERIEYPDLAVIDLDPSDGTTFNDVLEIAALVHTALEGFGIKGYPKTSGATGLHIFIPLRPRWSFSEVTAAMKKLAGLIVDIYPKKATIERLTKDRRGKVYLDFLQNTRGRSMAFPYSLRPLPGAPVSTPLTWEEVYDQKVRPEYFTLRTLLNRLQQKGDLYSDLLETANDLSPLVPAVKV